MYDFFKNTISNKDFNILKAAYLYFDNNVYFEFLEKKANKYDLGTIELDEYLIEALKKELLKKNLFLVTCKGAKPYFVDNKGNFVN